MRQKLTIGLLALLCSAMAITSCKKDDNDNIAALTADFEFSIGEQNKVTFTNKSTGYSFSAWNFGDNSIDEITTHAEHIYPYAGTYHVTLTVTASDGATASKEKNVVIETDNISGLLTPTVLKLTGGTATPNGRIWVFDQWNQYAAEVAEKTGKNVRGHMGLGPLNSYGQEWWFALPNEKAKVGWVIYEEEFKFTLNGLKLDITNPGGKGYGRLKLSSTAEKFPDATAWVDPNNNVASDIDAEFTYIGGSNTFRVTEPATEDDYPTLALSGNAFLGYYVGTQEYEIIYLTDEVLAVRAADPNDGTDNLDWVFVFIRPDLKEEPKPGQDKTLGEVSYPAEGFEATPAFEIVIDPSAGSSGIVDNPSKTGINTSDKVYKLEKTTDFWSHVYYLDAAHKFDLSTKNKIKVKVYIPSTNDYDTEGDLAGDWLTIKKLQKQLVLKLHDSSLGSNAYTTQVEIAKNGDGNGLATDTWLDLTFDFSGAGARTDFDKIIIQFGQEGHTRTGTFYFDDFQFFVE
jgi:PKD repeat protein